MHVLDQGGVRGLDRPWQASDERPMWVLDDVKHPSILYIRDEAFRPDTQQTHHTGIQPSTYTLTVLCGEDHEAHGPVAEGVPGLGARGVGGHGE
jgi:hypothetical protein